MARCEVSAPSELSKATRPASMAKTRGWTVAGPPPDVVDIVAVDAVPHDEQGAMLTRMAKRPQNGVDKAFMKFPALFNRA